MITELALHWKGIKQISVPFEMIMVPFTNMGYFGPSMDK